jgi:hypothetical protein
MYEIFLNTLTKEFSNDVINSDPTQTIIYIIINFILAYISYKIFNLIGEKYTKPTLSTKNLMNFFIFSSFYFFASGLFEILSIYYSVYLISKIGVLFNFTLVSIILFTFYFLSRYYLFLSAYLKFSKNKIENKKEISKTIKSLIGFGIILDFILFFHLWYTLDYIVLIYNTIILFMIFWWITRHRKESHKTLYIIYLLLLMLIFNRLNFMFIQFSYSDIYYFFDVSVSAILIGIYIITYKLIKKHPKVLEKK